MGAKERERGTVWVGGERGGDGVCVRVCVGGVQKKHHGLKLMCRALGG